MRRTRHRQERLRQTPLDLLPAPRGRLVKVRRVQMPQDGDAIDADHAIGLDALRKCAGAQAFSKDSCKGDGVALGQMRPKLPVPAPEEDLLLGIDRPGDVAWKVDEGFTYGHG